MNDKKTTTTNTPNAVYKVRHTETGLFSSGGVTNTRWSRTGKTWSHRAHVMAHLRQAVGHRLGRTALMEDMKKWEVLELVSLEKPLGSPEQFLKS